MKTPLKLFTTLEPMLCSCSLFAGQTNFNFNVDPTADPALTGAIIVGNHYYPNPSGFFQTWSSGAGAPIDGNPATGGFFFISYATNGGEGFVFVFPRNYNGAALIGFRICMGLRGGNRNPRPAARRLPLRLCPPR